MATAYPPKSERLEARLTAEQKEVLQRAAALGGSSVSDFVVRSAQREAERILREHDVVTLSARDSRVFVEALLNPPAPNDAFRAAAARYSDVMGRR